MNDGKPRRSLISYLLPYIFGAILIGVFAWILIGRMMGNSETWAESQIDAYMNVSLVDRNGKKVDTTTPPADGYFVSVAGEADPTDKDFSDYTGKGHKLENFTVYESVKSVYVSGTYINSSAKEAKFNVRFSAEQWNNSFVVTWVVLDSEGKPTGETVNATHVSYATIFEARVTQAKERVAGTKDYERYYWGVSDAFEVSWFDTWGPTIITVGVTVLLGIFLFSRLSSMGNAGGSAMSFNKSPARKANNTKVRFSDVAGCDEEKAEMVELVEYLKDPKKYTKFGARLPKGILLIGSPGTGKTLLAKAVAGEAGVPFYSISGSDFVEMYVGVGAGRVRDLFRQAKATAPCLIFIDEIDAVGRQRGAGLGGGNDEREQTLNQLLVEMDGFEPNSGILVIAATNRDDVLDPALRRAGRFDRTVTVSLPDRAGRKAIFEVHARGKNIDPSVDFEALAKRTVGFSGADIDSILNDAAILAVRGNKESIGLAEIDEAIDRRIAGPAKASRGMSEEERKQVAYHEAGHAVIGFNLPYSEKVQKITIVPRGNTGGHVLMTPEDDRFLMTKNQLVAEITGLLGGRVSEEIFFQDVSTGASNDIERATRIARSMVTEWGMSDLGPIQYERDSGSVFLGRDYTNTQRNFSTQIAFEIDKAVRQIVDDAHENAKKVLTDHKDQVVLVAERLLEKETITAEEIDYLCKNGCLPEPEIKPEEPKQETPEEPKPVEAEAVVVEEEKTTVENEPKPEE